MNLSFKAPLQKSWTLLNDRLIYGEKEILFEEIQNVTLFAKPTFATNGIIQIFVNNKVLNLAYTNRDKENGNTAFIYLESNFGDRNSRSDKKTMEDIQKEVKSLPCYDGWGTRKEVSELPKVLSKDESIKAMTSGVTDGNTWLIVCTNKRVLMLDKGLVYGLKIIDIPLDRINSISHSKGLVLGKISITDGATTRTIENISNVTVTFFCDIVNQEIENYKRSKNNPITQVVNNNSVADELLKFKQLLDMGVITEDEFSAKKKELLGL
ncbi:PH domain-containing protein [Turicibacter sanguinis]|uniref:PH domain-containing protein n=1 Tax=Turicibacter sanguinis TaxID=154288 RepID=UPI0023300DB4|nr:PH domain-containing protein [Turicibacter sanguinis]MDB8575344.1 PH domain-containing protein [Turicibacter sanguinis]MDB8577329.1 PH domain-containing protein [Turicibacter sanguinis]MDB8584372.1 PH domain-containing protein [Turicibacter sanguinis]MDB8586865.1 PH domain-containing protein [Turicibacter sanguinis]MDB8597585.1 PH domain-containing protein [Turicibacter sanguinis]